jgi:hypothetical protein
MSIHRIGQAGVNRPRSSNARITLENLVAPLFGPSAIPSLSRAISPVAPQGSSVSKHRRRKSVLRDTFGTLIKLYTEYVIDLSGAPYWNRTRVSAVKGQFFASSMDRLVDALFVRATFRLLMGLTMPQQVTPQNIFRELRRIRFSPRKGRRLGFTWLGVQTGYTRTAFYEALHRGSVTKAMAERVGAILQNVQISRDQVPPSTLGEYTDGFDARGGPRPARRPDDRRRRSSRTLGGTSGANASLGPYGGSVRFRPSASTAAAPTAPTAAIPSAAAPLTSRKRRPPCSRPAAGEPEASEIALNSKNEPSTDLQGEILLSFQQLWARTACARKDDPRR